MTSLLYSIQYYCNTCRKRAVFEMALGEKKVLISDSIDKCCQDALTKAGFIVDYRPGIKKDDLLSSIKVIQYINIFIGTSLHCCLPRIMMD